MPSPPSPDKQCGKCKRRQPLAEFTRGIPEHELAAAPRGSRYCHRCRTTRSRCNLCNRDRPIHEFARERGAKYGRCGKCHMTLRRKVYADAAQWATERALAEGRDPATCKTVQVYSRDQDEVLVAPKKRRVALERAAVKDGYKRADIFERDGWQCQLCGADLDRDTATIDHIIPLSLGGTDTTANVRTACNPCNSRRGNAENASAPRTEADIDAAGSVVGASRRRTSIGRRVERAMGTLCRLGR